MDKVIVLMLSIVMPQGVPDTSHAVPVKTEKECWARAKEWAGQELTDAMKSKGVIGLAAGCMIVQKPAPKDEDESDEKGKM